MPCFAHRRKAGMGRPGGPADAASSGEVRCSAMTEVVDPTTATSETSITARRHLRLGGTTPIPVVIANGRRQARIKEGSCGNGQY
jgi:hypothetical protein